MGPSLLQTLSETTGDISAHMAVIWVDIRACRGTHMAGQRHTPCAPPRKTFHCKELSEHPRVRLCKGAKGFIRRATAPLATGYRGRVGFSRVGLDDSETFKSSVKRVLWTCDTHSIVVSTHLGYVNKAATSQRGPHRTVPSSAASNDHLQKLREWWRSRASELQDDV